MALTASLSCLVTSPLVTRDAAEIEGRLRLLGDPERAANEARYLKSDLEHLWAVPIHERRSCAAFLLQARDFWVRRAALLARLAPARQGDSLERFFRYADAMLEEREFFIRKAIGWVLREAAKTRPDEVYEWLLPRATRASGVTMREAVKYLPEEQRENLLAQR
jgi:hypothetical protein